MAKRKRKKQPWEYEKWTKIDKKRAYTGAKPKIWKPTGKLGKPSPSGEYVGKAEFRSVKSVMDKGDSPVIISPGGHVELTFKELQADATRKLGPRKAGPTLKELALDIGIPRPTIEVWAGDFDGLAGFIEMIPNVLGKAFREEITHQLDIINHVGDWKLDMARFKFSGNLQKSTYFKMIKTGIGNSDQTTWQFKTSSNYYKELDEHKGLPRRKIVQGKLREWVAAKKTRSYDVWATGPQGLGMYNVRTSPAKSYVENNYLWVGRGFHGKSPYFPAGTGRNWTGMLARETNRKIKYEIVTGGEGIIDNAIELFAKLFNFAELRRFV